MEANTIGGGITKNTTANITSQHGQICDKIIKKYGIEKAKQYLEINQAALETYRDLCKNIDCDFEEKDSYVYSIDNRQNIEAEIRAINKLGFNTEFAKDFPFINKHGGYFIKMYQHRSYVIGLKNAADVNGIYVDESKTGMSFRNYKNLLFIGDGAHRTGKKGGNWEELRTFAKNYYPGAIEEYHWATQDCMTLASIPYIGPYSKGTKGLYVATGFNKWGMTSSMVSAMILCDMVQGRKNEYQGLFLPSRSILHPQLAVNVFESTKGLLTPNLKRCPHLGCALKWIPYEHTWDCPYHGSRFTENGAVIDNPTTGDLN